MLSCYTPIQRSPRAGQLCASLVLTALFASPALGRLCLNTARYLDLTDDTTDFPICHDGILTCETPVLGGPVYTVEPGCDPFLGSRGVTVEVDVEFPGNHQNDPLLVGLGYSFGGDWSSSKASGCPTSLLKSPE